MNISIKKLVIDLDGKEIELTLEQAKKLKSVLDELFKTKTKEVVKEVIIEREKFPWPIHKPYVDEPVYPTTPWEPYPKNPIIWCDVSKSLRVSL